MNIVKHWKAEMSRLNVKFALSGAAIILSLGMFSLIWAGNIGFYKELILPPASPPSWVFPFVWTFIYILLGFSISQILSVSERPMYEDKLKGTALFSAMMMFNIIWAPLFFGAQTTFLALIDVIIIAVLTFFAVFYFWRLNTLSALILIIYWLWLLYTVYLNLMIVLLN